MATAAPNAAAVLESFPELNAADATVLAAFSAFGVNADGLILVFVVVVFVFVFALLVKGDRVGDGESPLIAELEAAAAVKDDIGIVAVPCVFPQRPDPERTRGCGALWDARLELRCRPPVGIMLPVEPELVVLFIALPQTQFPGPGLFVPVLPPLVLRVLLLLRARTGSPRLKVSI